MTVFSAVRDLFSTTKTGVTQLTGNVVAVPSWAQQQSQAYQDMMAAQTAYQNQVLQAQQAQYLGNAQQGLAGQGLYHANNQLGMGAGAPLGGGFVTTAPNNGPFYLTAGGGGGSAVYTVLYPQGPLAQPMTAKSWFFTQVAYIEEYPAAGVRTWDYDDSVHRLLDRRHFNPKEVDLVGVIAFCLCNALAPSTVIDQFESLGVEFI